MRSITFIIILLFAFGFAHGQIQVGATVGAQFPTGDFGDGAKIGIGFNIVGKYMINDHIAVGLNSGYSRFDTQIDGLSCTMIPVTGLFEYHFGVQNLRPYIGVDAGVYNYGARIEFLGASESGSKTYFGFAPTGGILYGISDRLSFIANVKYNYVMAEVSAATWLGINAGLILRLN
jgi:hypothetical protein